MADDIIEGTYPTRMELLRIKERTKIADKGHRLLKEKRDALAMEFMSAARKAGDVASETSRSVLYARSQYVLGQGLIGTHAMASAGLATERDVFIEVAEKKMMGVSLPRLSVGELARTPAERGYGLPFTSPVVDQAAGAFEDALSRLVVLAEAEANITVLAGELDKTRRRVNALEHRVLPRLKNTTRYIEMHLEEQDRDSFSRLKKVKDKKKKKKK